MRFVKESQTGVRIYTILLSSRTKSYIHTLKTHKYFKMKNVLLLGALVMFAFTASAQSDAPACQGKAKTETTCSKDSGEKKACCSKDADKKGDQKACCSKEDKASCKGKDQKACCSKDGDKKSSCSKGDQKASCSKSGDNKSCCSKGKSDEKSEEKGKKAEKTTGLSK